VEGVAGVAETAIVAPLKLTLTVVVGAEDVGVELLKAEADVEVAMIADVVTQRRKPKKS